ncbi:putative Zinc transporter ZIP3 [Hypsibius exemplaris]|uniref:Zinc transporter ZIP3 n=1 Tax=Hypsibius exemplaris TaxID=2072580 RepID=A0A1W0X0Z8_HYPEX|nr:putative Zinc transporter ZIP3 [Hypsibius exemplaris]
MLVDIVLKRLRHSKSARELQERGAHQELQNAPSQAPLVLDDDDSSDDERSSVDTDPLAPSGIAPRIAGVGTRTEKLQVMKVTSRSSSGASRHSHSHSHSTAGHAGHNHSHHHHHDISFDDYQGATRFIVLVASLGTHSIFEGLALGLIKDVQLLMNMFISIIVHEVLMAFALGISLARQKMKLRSRLLFCFIFSVIIPLGQGVGLLIQQAPESGAVTAGRILFQAIAAGTFLHVMFMEILPQEMGSGHFGLAEAFWVAIGYLLIPLSSLISGEHDHH